MHWSRWNPVRMLSWNVPWWWISSASYIETGSGWFGSNVSGSSKVDSSRRHGLVLMAETALSDVYKCQKLIINKQLSIGSCRGIDCSLYWRRLWAWRASCSNTCQAAPVLLLCVDKRWNEIHALLTTKNLGIQDRTPQSTLNPVLIIIVGYIILVIIYLGGTFIKTKYTIVVTYWF